VLKTNESGIGKYLKSPSTHTKTLKRHLDFGSITQTETQKKKAKKQEVTVILQILGSH